MLFLFLLCRFFFLWPLISVFASTFRDAVQPLFPSAHPVQIITWKYIEYSTTSESNAVVVLAKKYNTVEMKRLLNKFKPLKTPKKSLKILHKKNIYIIIIIIFFHQWSNYVSDRDMTISWRGRWWDMIEGNINAHASFYLGIKIFISCATLTQSSLSTEKDTAVWQKNKS